MKILVNLIIIASVGLFLKWNFSSNPPPKIITPIDSKENVNPPILEEEYFNKEMSAKRLLFIHFLTKNNQLKHNDIKVDFLQTEDDNDFIDDLSLTKESFEIKYHFEINKEEAFYRVEKNLYSYDVIVFYNNEVVLQFNGHLDRNLDPAEFIDLDVVAYRPGQWEKIIKSLELSQ